VLYSNRNGPCGKAGYGTEMKRKRFIAAATEPTLNVELARLLGKRGLRALGEVIIHRRDGVDKPDIFITVNGIKLVVEGKFRAPSVEIRLASQCVDRIENGICEIAVSVIYENDAMPQLALTMADLEQLLLNAQFSFNVWYLAVPNVRETGWAVGNVDSVAQVIRNSYSVVVSEDLVSAAVEILSDALDDALQALTMQTEVGVLAERLRASAALPLGKPEGIDEG
jgi:hypothetical protein